MTTLADTLPNDAAALKAIVIAERAAHAAAIIEQEAEAERLRQIIKAFQRHRFGRRAETWPIDQLELALEDALQVEAAGGRTDEPNAQGSHREELPLRDPRAAS